MGLKYAQIKAEDVVFREQFFTPAYVADNGATVVGAPTISEGVTLNGTSQYLTYDGQFLHNEAEITIEVFFAPDFATDEDVIRFLFDSPVGERYSVLKFDNAANNVLRVNLGDTTIVDIAEGVYSPYWYVGGLNHLVIAGTTGATDVYLNNNLIVDGDATAWTPETPATFYVGSNNGGVQWFDGQLGEVSVYNRKYTAAEVEDRFQDRNTFREIEIDQLEFFLNLKTRYNNGASELTPNTGAIGSDTIKWGDGNTASTFPTLLDNNGASFDGGDYVLVNQSLAVVNTEPFTLGCMFRTTGVAGTFLMDCRAATNGFGFLLWSDGKVRGFTDTGAAGKFVETNGAYNDSTWHTCIVNYSKFDASNTAVSIYIDGELEISGNADIFTDASVKPVIGAEFDFSNGFVGDVKYPFFWRINLNATQAKWQSKKFFNLINA